MPALSLLYTVVLIVGLAAGVSVDAVSRSILSAALAGGWLAALLAYRRDSPQLQLAALALSTLAAGWLLGSAAVDRALNPPLRTQLEQRVGGFALDSAVDRRPDEPITVEGRLRGDARPSDTGIVLQIDVDRVWLAASPEPTEGGVSLTVTGALFGDVLASWTGGRRVRAPALLRRPARYLNRGLPDQERSLARRGITLVGTVKSAALVDVVENGRWWEEAAAAVRAHTRAAMARHVAARDPQAAAIATALLIGDRAAISHEVELRLQEAGTYHVIAISGGNIAILAAVVLGACALAGLRHRLAIGVTIAVLASYAVIASGGASVARATLMAILYLAIRLIDHRTAPANAIALTAAAILLINPLAIADVGFWLTFGATSAILVGLGQLDLPRVRWRAAIVTLLAASVCAELALAPVSALVFERVTLAGLLLNFAAIPSMTLVQLAAMLVVALDGVGAATGASWCGGLVRAATYVLTDSTRLLDIAPWLTWRVPPPAPAAMAIYYLALAAWWRGTKRSGVIACALFVWIVTAPAARVRALGDDELHVTMFDVGQGDALLVTFPNGRTLMVDTGGVTIRGDFDIGERVLGPALRARQLLALDYLAVTHGDPDHLGGARALVHDFTPREIWWGTPVPPHEPTAALQDEAVRRRAAWRTLQRGDRIAVGGVELRVHHPPPPDWERQKVRNNDSLVLELRYGQVSLLLTGDIEREVEDEILAALDLLPVVVLKVPHHGSGTSSSPRFVETLKPAIALIGAGRGNLYGHPLPYVLERYQQIGTEILRTDRDGQIDVVTDGRSVRIETFAGLRREIPRRHETSENTKPERSTWH